VRASPPEAGDAALFAAARTARERAYAPYSGFSVGAALRARDGRIFTGCNVENASYSLSICAERSALFGAVAAGARAFDAIAIAGPDGLAALPPCGACRQALAEFGAELLVVMGDASGALGVHTLAELLPLRFDRTALS
jgi:cytidine deaminase